MHTPIVIGQRIYTNLYGRGSGVVYAIRGAQTPDTIRSISGIMHTGGSAYFDIVFTRGGESKGLPECILRGVQWEIRDGVADQDEINALLNNAAVVRAEKEETEAKRKADFAASVAALRVNPDFSFLQQGNDSHGAKLAAANIRKELKASFAGKKFSVRVRGYDTVDISWDKGALTDEERAGVKKLTSKYQGGHFDGMTDCYNYESSPWTVVFGGAKYVFNQENWC
jgi:hypothetical protein